MPSAIALRHGAPAEALPLQSYREPRRVSGPIRLAGPMEVAFVEAREAILRYLRARGASNEAEDVLQDLWLRLATVETDGAEIGRAYLLRMAHNLLVDRHRARTRRGAREAAYHAAGPDAAPSAGEIAEARDRLFRVDRALAALGPRTDQVFRRHRVERMPQRQIADDLGISLSAVEKHLQKAYRAIAALARSDREDRS